MKTTLILLLILFSVKAVSQNLTTSIAVSVTNVVNKDGSVIFGLYNIETFMIALPPTFCKR